MSQNVTLSTTISPAQALALQALVSGGSITKAATEAGVARETVSRWVHHDPVFLAQLQNVRAELAIQTRCALEALGMQAVGVLVDAVQNQLRKSHADHRAHQRSSVGTDSAKLPSPQIRREEKRQNKPTAVTRRMRGPPACSPR